MIIEGLFCSLLGLNAETLAQPSALAPSNDNPAAYSALLQGNFYVQRNNPTDTGKAIAAFEEAIRLDPNYAMAHARLAYAMAFQVGVFNSYKDAAEAERLKQTAASEAEQALALDPQLPESWLARGSVHHYLDEDLRLAAQDYAHAAQLGPNNPRVLNALWTLQNLLGQSSGALATARRNVELEPLATAGYSNQGNTLLLLGRYNEAEALFKKALDLQPSNVSVQLSLIRLRIAQGNSAEALELAKSIRNPLWHPFYLEMAEFAAGDQHAADEGLNQFIAMGPGNESNVAELYAQRQEPDQMFDWLERAWARHDPGAQYIRATSFFLRYKNDPRYIAFGRKVGVIGPDEVP